MSEIRIHREHSLGLAQARKIAWAWAEQVESEFSMECTVEEGEDSDTLAALRLPDFAILPLEGGLQPLRHALHHDEEHARRHDESDEEGHLRPPPPALPPQTETPPRSCGAPRSATDR